MILIVLVIATLAAAAAQLIRHRVQPREAARWYVGRHRRGWRPEPADSEI